MTEQLDSAGRWWRVGPYEVDLNSAAGSYPANVRATALATRDNDGDQAGDVAALAEALVDGSIAAHPSAERFITQWMFDQAQRIVGRCNGEHAA